MKPGFHQRLDKTRPDLLIPDLIHAIDSAYHGLWGAQILVCGRMFTSHAIR